MSMFRSIMMRRFSALAIVALCAAAALSPVTAQAQEIWPLRLGIQTWTFKDKTFVETLDIAKGLGVEYVQAHRGQNLGEGFAPNEKFNHGMSPETRAKVLAELKKRGLKLSSYGVVNAPNEQEWRRVFDFAKAMKMENIAVEPRRNTWETVIPILNKLSKETGVGYGFHNHAGTSVKPADLDVVDSSVMLFGDTGHWLRAGWDPVETLKISEGRLIGMHLKDLNQKNPKGAHDMPWGTGVSDMAGQLAELRRQRFAGISYIEYEHRPKNQLELVARSVEFFNNVQKTDDASLKAGKVKVPQAK